MQQVGAVLRTHLRSSVRTLERVRLIDTTFPYLVVAQPNIPYMLYKFKLANNMQQEKIAILQYLQKQDGSIVVRNPIELGLTVKAFVVAVQSLCRNGLVEQDGLASAVLSGTPVTLRLTKVGVPTTIEVVQLAETAKSRFDLNISFPG